MPYTWKVLGIFTPGVSFNYQDRHLNCREEIVQHTNLKVKWSLKKSGWNLWVAGKDPAQQNELFPPYHEEEQQKSIWDSMTLQGSCFLFTLLLRMSILVFHHVPTLLHYWSEGIYRYIFLKGRGESSTLFFVENKIWGRWIQPRSYFSWPK